MYNLRSILSFVENLKTILDRGEGKVHSGITLAFFVWKNFGYTLYTFEKISTCAARVITYELFRIKIRKKQIKKPLLRLSFSIKYS